LNKKYFQIKLNETDLNDISKALAAGLYTIKSLDEECSPGTWRYQILNSEDLRIHAELRKKWKTYKDAKFLLNMRRAPAGYFVSSIRKADKKLIEIDVCLFSAFWKFLIFSFPCLQTARRTSLLQKMSSH